MEVIKRKAEQKMEQMNRFVRLKVEDEREMEQKKERKTTEEKENGKGGSQQRNESVPNIEDGCKKMNAFYMKKYIEFYTFDLGSEKTLEVILKGISCKKMEVKEDLESNNYKVQKVAKKKGSQVTESEDRCNEMPQVPNIWTHLENLFSMQSTSAQSVGM